MLLVSALVVLAQAPQPPTALAPWLDYAHQLAPERPDCPPEQSCVQLQRLEVSGRPAEGRITVKLSGANLGRLAARTTLVRPAATFSVASARFPEGRGEVTLVEDTWWLIVSPGRFTVVAELGFAPAPSLAVDFGGPFAAVVDELAAGRLDFDESSDHHAGAMTLVTAGGRAASEQAISIRVVRQLTYGSVVTFAYDYVVTGLREQTRLALPRLGEESFEALDPDAPFTVTPEGLVVTLSPGLARVRATGHFPARPARFEKPKALPFEHWLVDVDARHPAELSTSGLEINPSDVPHTQVSGRGRGFLLTGEQSLEVRPLEVTVERGQGGTGAARLSYAQGSPDLWVGTLELRSTIRPEEDRIEIPTPAPPHYAEVAGVPVRMYADAGTLSVRALAPDGRLLPVRVQWREQLGTNPVASALTLSLPEQALHLDSQSVNVSLLPGYVPVAVLGAESSSGDLVDGLHIYAVLLAALAVALARAAKFPVWAVVVCGVLFVGLYTVAGFPREQLLLLLVGCAVLMQLPARLLGELRRQRWLYGLAGFVWICVLLAALVPSVVYARERLLLALHPWSASHAVVDEAADGLFAKLEPMVAASSAPAGAPEEAQQDLRVDKSRAARQQEVSKKFEKLFAGEGGALLGGGGGGSLAGNLSNVVGSTGRGMGKGYGDVQAQIIRPVAFEGSSLPSSGLRFELGSTLPGTRHTTTVLVAGPWLRALWLLVECAGLFALWLFVMLAARRLWSAKEVA